MTQETPADYQANGSGEVSFRNRLSRRCRNRHRKRFWRDRDREEHECDSCGRGYAEVGYRWEVHHRDGDWMNGHPINLVGICHRCHIQMHRAQRNVEDVSGWTERFDAVADERLGGTVWRGMTAARKSAEHPDCAFYGCENTAKQVVTHPEYGGRHVCGAHIIAVAAGADGVEHAQA